MAAAADPAELLARAPGLVDEYLQRFGHVLNADNASELFPEYAASHDTRATRVGLVRPAAGRIVELAYARLLAEPVATGRLPLVVFTSGGNGAGKSTSVPPDGAEHIVFDSTLSQFEPSAANMERALTAGLHVDVRHLSRDIEESWRAVMHRAMHEGQGRTVTLRGFLGTHAGAPATFCRLAERYREDPRVNFLVWQNGPVGLHRRPMSWLRAAVRSDIAELESRLRDVLGAARAQGEISEAAFRGCAGVV